MSTLTVDLTVQREAFDVRADLTVSSGRALALVGPNGAGKSTVLAAIAGLVDASGTLSLDGSPLGDLPPETRRVAVVFQDFLLFPHLTVLDNVAFAFRVRGGGWRTARIAAQPWLERFDLAALADRHPEVCRVGRRNGSLSRGRSHPTPPCCCSTSRWGRSMSRSGMTCAPTSPGMCATSAVRRSS